MNPEPTPQDVLQGMVGLQLGLQLSKPTWGSLQEALTQAVQALLLQDMPRLMQLLYRMDVPEVEAVAAFQQATLTGTAQQLAAALLRRELYRLQTRRNYNIP